MPHTQFCGRQRLSTKLCPLNISRNSPALLKSSGFIFQLISAREMQLFTNLLSVRGNSIYSVTHHTEKRHNTADKLSVPEVMLMKENISHLPQFCLRHPLSLTDAEIRQINPLPADTSFSGFAPETQDTRKDG